MFLLCQKVIQCLFIELQEQSQIKAIEANRREYESERRKRRRHPSSVIEMFDCFDYETVCLESAFYNRRNAKTIYK